MHGAHVPGVPSHPALRAGRIGHRREHLSSLSAPQPVRSRSGLRPSRDFGHPRGRPIPGTGAWCDVHLRRSPRLAIRCSRLVGCLSRDRTPTLRPAHQVEPGTGPWRGRSPSHAEFANGLVSRPRERAIDTRGVSGCRPPRTGTAESRTTCAPARSRGPRARACRRCRGLRGPAATRCGRRRCCRSSTHTGSARGGPRRGPGTAAFSLFSTTKASTSPLPKPPPCSSCARDERPSAQKAYVRPGPRS